MHKNPVWLTLLTVLALIVLIFSGITVHRVLNYYYLDASVPAERVDWSIMELKKHSVFELVGLGEELFALKGDYAFTVADKPFLGSSTLDDPLFRNLYAAQQELAAVRTKPAKVWYNSSNPAYSSLQKKFPLKECLSASILFGLLLYFIWLGFSVGRH